MSHPHGTGGAGGAAAGRGASSRSGAGRPVAAAPPNPASPNQAAPRFGAAGGAAAPGNLPAPSGTPVAAYGFPPPPLPAAPAPMPLYAPPYGGAGPRAAGAAPAGGIDDPFWPSLYEADAGTDKLQPFDTNVDPAGGSTPGDNGDSKVEEMDAWDRLVHNVQILADGGELPDVYPSPADAVVTTIPGGPQCYITGCHNPPQKRPIIMEKQRFWACDQHPDFEFNGQQWRRCNYCHKARQREEFVPGCAKCAYCIVKDPVTVVVEASTPRTISEPVKAVMRPPPLGLAIPGAVVRLQSTLFPFDFSVTARSYSRMRCTLDHAAILASLPMLPAGRQLPWRLVALAAWRDMQHEIAPLPFQFVAQQSIDECAQVVDMVNTFVERAASKRGRAERGRADNLGTAEPTAQRRRTSDQAQQLMDAFASLHGIARALSAPLDMLVNRIKSDSGHNLLSLSILFQEWVLVHALLACGADVDFETPDGSPVEMLRRAGMWSLLVAHGYALDSDAASEPGVVPAAAAGPEMAAAPVPQVSEEDKRKAASRWQDLSLEIGSLTSNEKLEALWSTLPATRVPGFLDTVVDRDSGATMLHVAAEEGNHGAIKWLLEHGASAEQLNKFGMRPLELSQAKSRAVLQDVFSTTKLLVVTVPSSPTKAEGASPMSPLPASKAAGGVSTPAPRKDVASSPLVDEQKSEHFSHLPFVRALIKNERFGGMVQAFRLRPLEAPAMPNLVPLLAQPAGLKDMPRISAEDVVVEEQIVRGSAALVSKGQHRGVSVVVKQFHQPSDDVAREALALFATRNHPNIVQLVGYNRGLIVTEHVARGSLHTVLYTPQPEIVQAELVQPDVKRKILLGVVDALVFLHQRGIAHNNLQPSNVVLTADFTAKLCGFGDCIVQGRGPLVRGAQERPLVYRASELAKLPAVVTAASDVYSFGILMNELIGEVQPFVQSDSKSGLPVLAMQDGPVADLIHECLSSVPEKRPSAAAIRTRLARLTLSDNPIVEEMLTS